MPHSPKCVFHRKRSLCTVLDCTNQSVLRGKCVRHGAKRLCDYDGCYAPTRGRKFCPNHGGSIKKRMCIEPHCQKLAHANRKCVSHGGGRYCKVPGCQHHIRVRGLCRMHMLQNTKEEVVQVKTEVHDPAFKHHPSFLMVEEPILVDDKELDGILEQFLMQSGECFDLIHV
ncbi:hypothetical protein AeMF1_000408 [Aphanomyces euteiches]|nr:hypothetical protein AeMF1_000408 [Aphanomyces euteiches]KAH9167740.1 hypothetical protein AeNC1_018087 [Aphanomyces euteiches]